MKLNLLFRVLLSVLVLFFVGAYYSFSFMEVNAPSDVRMVAGILSTIIATWLSIRILFLLWIPYFKRKETKTDAKS